MAQDTPSGGQGDRNPEFVGTDVNHPTSPSAPQSAESIAAMERFGRSDAAPDYTRNPSQLPPGDSPSDSSAGGSVYQGDDPDAKAIEGEGGDGEVDTGGNRDAWLVAKAHEIYTTSTDYIDANITNQWETNLSHFNNQHAPGTALRSTNWKRSRVFRPKTRAATKSAEAALTVAAFSTQDVVDIQPEDERDPLQRASASVVKELIDYRLDRRMPWFQTAVGAYQCTKVYGLCISHQYWRYEADTDYEPALKDDGSLMTDEEGYPLGYEVPLVRKDELTCDLVAPENFRFDPMCDWRDPCTSSPYLLYMMPVYAGEALERMETIDRKTNKPTWRKYPLGELLATRRKNYDRTRQAREGRRRIDPADEQHGNAYTTLWAHMNIVKINGSDYVYWTMGTELVLTEPMLLTEACPWCRDGERPFTVGFSTIEAFRNYPAGDVEQSAGLQEEINLIANQRMDNVKLVLNKRYYVRRGAQVDLDALVRNVPGGGVMMNDTDRDVKTVNTPDVTQSSYVEQEKLASEMDELIGNFAQGSVQSNREGGDGAVGNNAMMSQTAGSVSDYGLRIFFETWMEPTLKQLVKLEQMYETDETILALATNKSQMLLRYGISKVTDSLINQDLVIRVNVGMGNTDPIRRVERLLFGIEKTASLPKMAEKLKSEDAANEIFGALGYRDASRFYRSDEEQKQKLTEMGDQTPPEIKLKQEEFAIRKEDNLLRHQRELMKMELEGTLGFAAIALEKQMTLEKLYGQLGIDRDKLAVERQDRAIKASNEVTKLRLAATGGGAA